MPRLKYKSTGTSRLKRLLRALPAEATDGLKEALRQSAEEMAATARDLVPVDTGTLRDSIEVSIRAKGFSAKVGPGARTKRTREEAFYARFVEMGTKGNPDRGIPPMAPQYYMQRAFDQNKGAAVRNVKHALRRAIEAAGAKAGSRKD